MDRDVLADQIRRQMTDLRLLARDEADGVARAAILRQVDELEGLLADIRILAADELAGKIAASVDALEEVRTAHGLDAVSVLGSAIDGLSAAEHSLKRDDPAPATPPPPPMAARVALPLAAAAVAAVAAVGASQVVHARNSRQFSELQDEYADLFGRCVTKPDKQGDVDRMAKRIKANRARYEAVGGPLGIPWPFVGITHALEASLSFDTHLHNGDPLTARTVQVPSGRPKTGSPPFTWEESATDALKLKKLDQNTDWSTPRMLFLFETFNGFGYRSHGVVSPYLWSFSNLYEKGKFVRDGNFDPEFVSRQCGAALLLKALR